MENEENHEKDKAWEEKVALRTSEDLRSSNNGSVSSRWREALGLSLAEWCRTTLRQPVS